MDQNTNQGQPNYVNQNPGSPNPQQFNRRPQDFPQPQPVKPLGKQPSSGIMLASIAILILTFVVSAALASVFSWRSINGKELLEAIGGGLDVEGISLDKVVGEEVNMRALSRIITERLGKNSISREELEEILEEIDLEDSLNEYLDNFTGYLFKGGELPAIDIEEYLEQAEEKKEEIEEILGQKISDLDFENAKEIANDYADEFNETIKEFSNEYEDSFSILHTMASIGLFLGIIGVMALFLILLVVLYKLNGSGIYRAFRGYAVSTGIAGLLFVAIGSIFPGLVEELSESADAAVIELVANVFRAQRNGGVLLLGISVICIIAAIVSNIVYRKALQR